MSLEGMTLYQPKLIFFLWIPKDPSFPQEFKEWDLSDNIPPVFWGCSFPTMWLWVRLSDPVKITNSPNGEKGSLFHSKGQQIHSSHSSLHTAPGFWTCYVFLVFSVTKWSEESLEPKEENGNWFSLPCPRRLVLPLTKRIEWDLPVTSSLRKPPKGRQYIRRERKAHFSWVQSLRVTIAKNLVPCS